MTSRSRPHGDGRVTVSMLLTAVALATAVAGSADAAPTILVPEGSAWAYRDDGSNQGTAWRALGFDDGSWANGPAQLGYGDGDEATVVSFGPTASAKFITTYFRHTFVVAGASSFQGASIRLMRDDGAVVYLNGVEIFRSNMPTGSVSHLTTAQSAVGGAAESAFFTADVDPTLLIDGANVLAVEIHQSSGTSSDISFDLELTADDSTSVVRGPYLQRGTASELVVRWRTSIPTASRVAYGPAPGSLTSVVDDLGSTTEHEVLLTELTPDTLYYYSVGSPSEPQAGDDLDHHFRTAPAPGTAAPTRVWILGDSGTANDDARRVRDAYTAFTGTQRTDVWLMLGDNAYTDGTDAEYQSAVFDTYPSVLRTTVLWSTLGNHDGHNADSGAQTGPYYDMFTFPRFAEAGGVASGTEAYYSFDHANIHFVCLDSYDSDRSPSGPMLTWLAQDLQATTAQWVIAFWHHPPYSKGSHDSDTESELVQMRTNALPILEAYGVDLVLSGHSHSYERSLLLDSHYGVSGTFGPGNVVDGGDGDPAGDGAYAKPTLGPGTHEGAIYAVAGSSGKVTVTALDHPAMVVALPVLGSLVVDVDGETLTARFLDDLGLIDDTFQIVKGGGTTTTTSVTSTSTSSSSTVPPICDGDGVCEAGEDCGSCPTDCVSATASCGDGVCQAGDGENCLSCPQDCRGVQSGKKGGRFCCGDGDGEHAVSCSDARCTTQGFVCADVSVTACCGDGSCTPAEAGGSCTLDCGAPPACGDGTCDPGETSCSCAADCGTPPTSETSCTNGADDDCDGQTDCADGNCSTDPACTQTCAPAGASCGANAECCSSSCRGGRNKTCR